MANYVVTTRNKDGSIAERSYTANDRSDLFKQLAADGVTAVSVREGVASKKKQPRKAASGNAPSKGRGLIAAAIVVLGLGAAVWFLMPKGETKVKEKKEVKKVVKAEERVIQEEPHTAKVVRIRREFNDRVKDFIKKTPGTNKIDWVVAPLDPEDPDNALRTAIAKDIGSLLSITPGERIPPIIPFSFMFEDDAIESAAVRGDKVVKFDGGNKRFLEELKKWKVTVKEGDSEARIAAKNELMEVQLELLKNMDEGVSVNDSIRAAYDFRMRAAEVRSEMIAGLKEIHDSDPDVSLTKEMIAAANKQLKEEGIMLIKAEDVLPEEDLGN